MRQSPGLKSGFELDTIPSHWLKTQLSCYVVMDRRTLHDQSLIIKIANLREKIVLCLLCIKTSNNHIYASQLCPNKYYMCAVKCSDKSGNVLMYITDIPIYIQRGGRGRLVGRGSQCDAKFCDLVVPKFGSQRVDLVDLELPVAVRGSSTCGLTHVSQWWVGNRQRTFSARYRRNNGDARAKRWETNLHKSFMNRVISWYMSYMTQF